jgi:hypothetical protein
MKIAKMKMNVFNAYIEYSCKVQITDVNFQAPATEIWSVNYFDDLSMLQMQSHAQHFPRNLESGFVYRHTDSKWEKIGLITPTGSNPACFLALGLSFLLGTETFLKRNPVTGTDAGFVLPYKQICVRLFSICVGVHNVLLVLKSQVWAYGGTEIEKRELHHHGSRFNSSSSNPMYQIYFSTNANTRTHQRSAAAT